jgi:PTS system nitrogen regulatory IIA component
MDTILDALQEGRLFELPESDKNRSLQFLAHVMEAFPQIPPGTDIVGMVMAREAAMNTALDFGWACPHAPVDFEGALTCVVGWSPTPIDYGAPNGKMISLIAMYLVPSNQRNHYLRQISIMAKVLQAVPGAQKKLDSVKSLNDVRGFLLDLVSVSKDTAGPDARARMIRLQVKSALAGRPADNLANILIEPLTIVSVPGMAPIVLTQNPELLTQADSSPEIVARLVQDGFSEKGPWRIVKRSASDFRGGRTVMECLAISMRKGDEASPPAPAPR